MGLPLFGTPIYSDASVSYTPVASGGSWAASLPASNVMDRRLARVARSTDATEASCTIVFDLGVARRVGCLAVLLPNVTKSSVPTVRWKANTTNSFGSPAYDSGTVQAWPTGLSAEDAAGLNVWSPVIPVAAQTYQWWQLVVSDTANVDGHLDVARAIIAGAYVPSFNMNTGSKTALETDTIRTVTDGGAAIYQPKPTRRSDTFQISNLTQAEVFTNVRAMQRRLGTSGQLFFVFDQSDTTLMYERAYLCVLRQLDDLEYPWGTAMDTAYSLLEEL